MKSSILKKGFAVSLLLSIFGTAGFSSANNFNPPQDNKDPHHGWHKPPHKPSHTPTPVPKKPTRTPTPTFTPTPSPTPTPVPGCHSMTFPIPSVGGRPARINDSCFSGGGTTASLLVGDDGAIFRFDGTAFTRLQSPTTEDLNAVECCTDDDGNTVAYVVGDKNTLLASVNGGPFNRLSGVPFMGWTDFMDLSIVNCKEIYVSACDGTLLYCSDIFAVNSRGKFHGKGKDDCDDGSCFRAISRPKFYQKGGCLNAIEVVKGNDNKPYLLVGGEDSFQFSTFPQLPFFQRSNPNTTVTTQPSTRLTPVNTGSGTADINAIVQMPSGQIVAVGDNGLLLYSRNDVAGPPVFTPVNLGLTGDILSVDAANPAEILIGLSTGDTYLVDLSTGTSVTLLDSQQGPVESVEILQDASGTVTGYVADSLERTFNCPGPRRTPTPITPTPVPPTPTDTPTPFSSPSTPPSQGTPTPTDTDTSTPGTPTPTPGTPTPGNGTPGPSVTCTETTVIIQSGEPDRVKYISDWDASEPAGWQGTGFVPDATWTGIVPSGFMNFMNFLNHTYTTTDPNSDGTDKLLVRRTFNLPAGQVTSAQIRYQLDDNGFVWMNGVSNLVFSENRVGIQLIEHTEPVNPAFFNPGGTNVLAIRVNSNQPVLINYGFELVVTLLPPECSTPTPFSTPSTPPSAGTPTNTPSPTPTGTLTPGDVSTMTTTTTAVGTPTSPGGGEPTATDTPGGGGGVGTATSVTTVVTTPVFPDRPFRSIVCIPNGNAVIAGDGGFVGIVDPSLNLGQIPVVIGGVQVTADLNSIYRCDTDSWWVAGDSGTIVYTDNGGATWSQVDLSACPGLSAVNFTQITGNAACNRFIVASDAGRLLTITVSGGGTVTNDCGPALNTLVAGPAASQFVPAAGVTVESAASLANPFTGQVETWLAGSDASGFGFILHRTSDASLFNREYNGPAVFGTPITDLFAAAAGNPSNLMGSPYDVWAIGVGNGGEQLILHSSDGSTWQIVGPNLLPLLGPGEVLTSIKINDGNKVVITTTGGNIIQFTYTLNGTAPVAVSIFTVTLISSQALTDSCGCIVICGVEVISTVAGCSGGGGIATSTTVIPPVSFTPTPTCSCPLFTLNCGGPTPTILSMDGAGNACYRKPVGYSVANGISGCPSFSVSFFATSAAGSYTVGPQIRTFGSGNFGSAIGGAFVTLCGPQAPGASVTIHWVHATNPSCTGASGECVITLTTPLNTPTPTPTCPGCTFFTLNCGTATPTAFSRDGAGNACYIKPTGYNTSGGGVGCPAFPVSFFVTSGSGSYTVSPNVRSFSPGTSAAIGAVPLTLCGPEIPGNSVTINWVRTDGTPCGGPAPDFCGPFFLPAFPSAATAPLSASALSFGSPTPDLSEFPPVSARPNVSRNGEPVRFWVKLDKPGRVDLGIFNVAGEQVLGASFHGSTGLNQFIWDLKNQAGTGVVSGIYPYFLRPHTGVVHKGKVAVFR